jgi:hypothetical protein
MNKNQRIIISILTVVLPTLLLMAGCINVKFATPQPDKGRTLKKIPKIFTGTYADTTFTLTLSPDTLYFEKQALVITRTNPDENEVQLRFYSPYYFAVFKDSVYYNIFMANFYDNKLAIYMINSDKRTIALLNRVVKVDTINSEKGWYLIDPSLCEFDEILEWDIWEPAAVLTKTKNDKK